MVLNLGAGYIYGPVPGALITSAGTSVGSLLSFLSLRYIFMDYMKALTSRYSNYRKLVRVIESKQGFKLMMMSRLTPLPIGVQNAIYASTKVSSLQFFQTTTLGLMPTQFINSYMGSTLRDLEAVLKGDTSATPMGPYMVYVQLAFFVLVTLYIQRRMREEVDRECEAKPDPIECTHIERAAVPLPTSSSPVKHSAIDTRRSRRDHRRTHSDGSIAVVVDYTG